uniref:Uncharacterized protein n=1 Tax=Avena sativa TaxID=4498 RepID=A0ACD5ZF16_AVESA
MHAMTMTTQTIFLLLLALAPLRMAAAGKNCPGVPWLGAVAACRKASSTKFIYDLCIRTMREDGVDMSPSHKQEVTAYIILATEDAANSYDSTQLVASNQLDQNASLPGPVRDAYEGCLNDYPAAEDSLDRVTEAMRSGCDFVGIADQYTSGMMSLENCRDRLLSLQQYKTPVYPMVLADRDKVSLAYMLAKLLGI